MRKNCFGKQLSFISNITKGMEKIYYTAIVFCYEPFQALKYRNIGHYSVPGFMQFIRAQYPNAHHVNFYSADQTFAKREYF